MENWYSYIPMIFILFMIIIFIIILDFRKAIINEKKELKKLIETQEKRSFKYIDSIYFEKKSVNEIVDKTLVIYHIIEDIKTNKYYAISTYHSNVSYFGGINNLEIKNASKETIKYGDNGSFWIKPNSIDNYKIDENNIIIDDYLIKDINDIKNYTNNFNLSSLNKINFIDGYIEFDSKNK